MTKNWTRTPTPIAPIEAIDLAHLASVTGGSAAGAVQACKSMYWSPSAGAWLCGDGIDDFPNPGN